MQLRPKAATIVEVLLELENCTRYGARFVSRGEEPTYYTYEEVIKRAKSVAGSLQAQGLNQGDRVAVILPTSIRFLDIFLGVQLAGGIPAALYPPFRFGRLTEYFQRTQKMLAKIGSRFFISDRRIKKIMGPAVEKVGCVKKALNAENLLVMGIEFDIDYTEAMAITINDPTRTKIVDNDIDVIWNASDLAYGIYSYVASDIGSETNPVNIRRNTITVAGGVEATSDAFGIYLQNYGSSYDIFAAIEDNDMSGGITAGDEVKGIHVYCASGDVGSSNVSLNVSDNQIDVNGGGYSRGIYISANNDLIDPNL